ncbi:MAG: hypothetical protein JST00_30320 [Deltaproteobacteria bacterium]|nr:hypothetical protein [Deltaproteobacteria bacterium]
MNEPALRTTTTRVAAALLAVLVLLACKPKSVQEAETKKDIAWLAEEGSPMAIAALGRLADADPKALAAVEKKAQIDVSGYIAAWEAVKRNAPWGATLLRAGLADPTRADAASSALPRGNPLLVQFTGDLENAVVRLSAGSRGSIVAGVLASIGPPAHAHVERRLLDPKTRGGMCDGIGLPEASGDAKSILLAVPPEGRDHQSCINVVLTMAATEDVLLAWLATGAEPGLLSAAAKGTLPCARLATIWNKGLVERPAESHAALAVPLQLSIKRCAVTLDPVLGDLLTKAPRSRGAILLAIEPFSDMADLKQTCKAMRGGWVAGEPPRVRDRAQDALAHGCTFAH